MRGYLSGGWQAVCNSPVTHAGPAWATLGIPWRMHMLGREDSANSPMASTG